MNFFNPNQPNFLPPQQQPFTPGGGVPGATPTDGGLPVFTPQQLAHVAEVLVQSILLSPPGAGANLGMTPQQLSAFFKNLLQMPKEIQQLLAMLITQEASPTQEMIKALIAQNPKISLEDLQKVLTQKVKQGELQLTRLLQSAQMNHTTESSKMGDLLNTVSQIGARIAASPADSLVMTMLLYLPWYPISVHQKLQMQYQPGEDDAGGERNQENAEQQASGGQLVLMMETEHLGNFRIATSLMQANQIYFHVTHSPKAKEHLADIEEKLKQAFDSQQLMTGIIEFEERTQIEAMPQITPETAAASTPTDTPQQPPVSKEQAVAVRGMGGPSIQLVQGAYLLMRIIFETDDRIDLELKRAHIN